MNLKLCPKAKALLFFMFSVICICKTNANEEENLKISSVLSDEKLRPTEALKIVQELYKTAIDIEHHSHSVLLKDPIDKLHYLMTDKSAEMRENKKLVLQRLKEFKGKKPSDADQITKARHKYVNDMKVYMKVCRETFDEYSTESRGISDSLKKFTELRERLMGIDGIALIYHGIFVKKFEKEDEQKEDYFVFPDLPSEASQNSTFNKLSKFYDLYQKLDQVEAKLLPYKNFEKKDWMADDKVRTEILHPALKELQDVNRMIEKMKEDLGVISYTKFLDDMIAFIRRTERHRQILVDALKSLQQHLIDHTEEMLKIEVDIDKEFKRILSRLNKMKDDDDDIPAIEKERDEL